MRKRVVVVCPGRGTYTQKELGYIKQNHLPQNDSYIAKWNNYRAQSDLCSLNELDESNKFTANLHLPGENSSALIGASALCDFKQIDTTKYEIVAITGNSMGWYLALACAEVLDEMSSIHLVQTMGSMMKEKIIGAQLIYPVMNNYWQLDQAEFLNVQSIVKKINQTYSNELFISIYFGHYIVFGGSKKAIRTLHELLPKKEIYPFILPYNGAFHTPLMTEISKKAKNLIDLELFSKPNTAIIDGAGKIYEKYSSSTKDLYEYTLHNQVCESYHFTRAIQVAAKEFAPDLFIALGPGSQIGGAIIQSLVSICYKDLKSKQDFEKSQQSSPLILSMGRSDQRSQVIK